MRQGQYAPSGWRIDTKLLRWCDLACRTAVCQSRRGPGNVSQKCKHAVQTEQTDLQLCELLVSVALP